VWAVVVVVEIIGRMVVLGGGAKISTVLISLYTPPYRVRHASLSAYLLSTFPHSGVSTASPKNFGFVKKGLEYVQAGFGLQRKGMSAKKVIDSL
jgi:hypothetical protein